VLSLSYSDIENRRKAESLSLLMLEALKTIPVWVKFSKQTQFPKHGLILILKDSLGKGSVTSISKEGKMASSESTSISGSVPEG
jgi:hypothetical protein